MNNQDCNCNNQEHSRCDNQEHSKCDNQERGNYDNQKHVHEITGSTAVVSECKECHNHRFCTVSGEAIPMSGSHVHEVKFRTDFADGHYHEFCGKSSTAIDVGGGKHVHFAKAFTTLEDGHRHPFQVASLIESPIDFKHHN